MTEHAPPGAGYEVSDASPRAIVRAGIVLAVVVALVAGGLVFYLRLLAARDARRDPPARPVAREDADRRPPQPRLQERPFEDVRILRAEQEDAATTYGWVDEEKGVVRIPVEQAMRLIAERGLPARAPASPSSASPAPAASPSPPAATAAPRRAPAPQPSPSPGGRE